MGVIETSFGDHFAIYTYIESCCTPKSNIMLYVNYTSINHIYVEKKNNFSHYIKFGKYIRMGEKILCSPKYLRTITRHV